MFYNNGVINNKEKKKTFMKRKIVLIPLALAAILGMASCGGESTETSGGGDSTSVATTKVTVSAESVRLKEGATQTVTATVSNVTDQTVTWSTSDATIATVAAGVITGVKEGTATITVTSVADATAKATIAVEVNNATKITISELLDGTTAKENVLYEAEGILESLKHTDQYGNAYLTDAEAKKTIKIYGMTTTESALVAGDDGTLTYTNPKDAKETLANINNGEKIKVRCVYNARSKNISCILQSHEASGSIFKVNIASFENGTATTDKTTYAYGETVTLTVTPNTGYTVDYLEARDVSGSSISATSTATNVYTFAASAINNVTVALWNSNSGNTRVIWDCTSASAPNKYATEDTEYTATVGTLGEMTFGGIGVGQNSGYEGAPGYLMFNTKKNGGKVAYYYSKTAIPGSIVSITLKTNTGASDSAKYAVTFGTAALSTQTTEEGVLIKKDSRHTFEASTTGNSYFQIACTTSSYNGQLTEVKIVYTPTSTN